MCSFSAQVARGPLRFRAACLLLLRTGLLAVILLTASMLPVSAAEKTQKASRTPRTPDTSDDRLAPYAFVGEVNNHFAASARNILDRRADEDKSRIDHAAGFGFDYRVLGQAASPWQLLINGQTVHPARTKLATNDSVNTATQQSDRFLEVLHDGTVLEAEASLKVRRVINTLQEGAGPATAATAVYVKGQGGLIRSGRSTTA